uniref:Uncharacterized protein n=1 Tax=Physcomitrium patens TaxID=3218 RepID=A0A7I4CW44_PHYPA
MDKFTGETILVEGKHVVVVPIGFLTDQVVPLGSRVLFSKTSKSLFQFETFDDNGIAKASPGIEDPTSFTNFSASPTNVRSPICHSVIQSPSPVTTSSTTRHNPLSSISKGVVAAKQHLAGKENPTVVKICGKAKSAIGSITEFQLELNAKLIKA